MNLKNDVILITSHAPDTSRKLLLEDLIMSIDRSKYDIVVSTNVPLEEKVQSLCDGVVFDNQNVLLTDFDKKISLWVSTESFNINSTDVKGFNHILAAQQLITNGLNWCKNRGYEKLHFLEYDSRIIDFTIFEENNKILNDFTVVWYPHPAGHGLFSSYSVNLKRLPAFWFDLSLKEIKEYVEVAPQKIIEAYGMTQLTSTVGTYEKDFRLYQNRVISNLYNTDNYDNWTIVVADSVKQEFVCFVMNNTQDILNVDFIANDQDPIKVETKRGFWSITRLGTIEEVNDIKISIDGELKRHHNFSNINKEKYISLNRIDFK